MKKQVFVFVVCGGKEHIDTLHFSLKYLKKYSRNDIWILTDSSRNEIPIIHSHIINIETPTELNHHQASIYLKTGIHQYLPKGNQYCYLDTDVVAVSTACDSIFNSFQSPIIFGADHCKVKKFSSYAVNCTCLQSREVSRRIFTEYVNAFMINDPLIQQKANRLQFEFDQIKLSAKRKITTALRYFTSYPIFKLNSDFYFNKKSRTWHDSSGEIVMYEMNIAKMQKETGLRYNRWTQKWYDKEGQEIWQNECDHLTDAIKETFGIDVAEKNWQHWNGGVFVFDDHSHEFLNAWHTKTMQIFKLPYWKTRDQGTLIATAWEFGLAGHPTLNKQFNFLADFNNKGVQIDTQTDEITDDGFSTRHKPALLHVYHHWMDQSWPVWQWIELRLNKKIS
jgi:hypothetical protein